MPVRSKKALVEKAVEMELVSKSSSACYCLTVGAVAFICYLSSFKISS